MTDGQDAEFILSLDLFDRDGWICGLCSEPIPSDLRWPEPLSASVDHIIPLSKGGRHTLDNVQAAHLICNISKGAKVPY
ncbi:MAG TPA: HNH endonuclease [Nocardioidaceae bacterium]|nr:HNH endonuclease [Nocardioidaceae bacterium]